MLFRSGTYGDQEIESRLQLAYSELREIVGVSKSLSDLQLLLLAVNASASASVASSRFQEPFNQIADRAAS